MPSDLIDRVELLEFARIHIDGTIDCNDIARFPAADAEPVRHGRWETTFGSYCTPHCTKCGWHIPYSEDSVLDARNYCPNCGAKMDGGREDEKT